MKIRESISLYWHYVSILVRSMMQYKTSFLLTTIGQFLASFNVFLGIYFMLRRFQSVKGFSYSEVLLCYGIFLLAISTTEMFARGFDLFQWTVKSGEFDRILVRPRGTILQVAGSRFELTRIGRMLQAVVMFAYGLFVSEIKWSFAKLCTVIFMLLGGSALFFGLFLIYASICFFTLEGLESFKLLINGPREYGKYPMGVYGKTLLKLVTYVIPYALVQYYPFLYLTDRVQSPAYIFLPLLGAWVLLPGYAFWRYGVKKYQSSGS